MESSSPSPNLRLGEGARRADEGRGAQRSGVAACTTVALSARRPSSGASRPLLPREKRGRRGKWTSLSYKPPCCFEAVDPGGDQPVGDNADEGDGEACHDPSPRIGLGQRL